jgi:hypothetical protein
VIKAKFRDHVRSKTDVAMVNEVLCKIICHNICCLIQESHELGIDTTFRAENSLGQKAAGELMVIMQSPIGERIEVRGSKSLDSP